MHLLVRLHQVKEHKEECSEHFLHHSWENPLAVFGFKCYQVPVQETHKSSTEVSSEALNSNVHETQHNVHLVSGALILAEDVCGSDGRVKLSARSFPAENDDNPKTHSHGELVVVDKDHGK